MDLFSSDAISTSRVGTFWYRTRHKGAVAVVYDWVLYFTFQTVKNGAILIVLQAAYFARLWFFLGLNGVDSSRAVARRCRRVEEIHGKSMGLGRNLPSPIRHGRDDTNVQCAYSPISSKILRDFFLEMARFDAIFSISVQQNK